MINDLKNINSALNFLKKYGLPAIQYEQKRWVDGVLNMSTTATFFSAIAATTLQTSIGYEQTLFFSLINTFWLCSLTLSIGAALNSLLALVWKQTTYGTRGRRLPLWVTIWIHTLAPIFLALSITCFSAGLVLFSYASQRQYTFIVTLVSTAITSFGLVTVSAWIAHKHWIAPLVLKTSLPASLEKVKTALMDEKQRPSSRRTASHTRRRTELISIQSHISTTSNTSPVNVFQGIYWSNTVSNLINGLRSLNGPEPHDQKSSTDFDRERQASDREGTDGEQSQNRWKFLSPILPPTKASTQGSSIALPSLMAPTLVPVPVIHLPEHFESYTTTPSSLSVKGPKRLSFPFGSIKDLAYSPDGLRLGVTGYKDCSTTAVLDAATITGLQENYPCPEHYQHSRGGMGIRVAWSPDGQLLLVHLSDKRIDLLTSVCGYRSTISRPHSIESAVWFDSSTILTTEQSTIYIINLEGRISGRIPFPNILLRDVAISPDSNILLAVGRVFNSQREDLPAGSRAKKRLILWDMATGKHLRLD